MKFKELLLEFVEIFISVGNLGFTLWKINPIFFSVLLIWIMGVNWNIYTNKRDFLLSLIWFIPQEIIWKFQDRKEIKEAQKR